MNSIFQAVALKIQSHFNGFDKAVKSGPMSFSSKEHFPVFILGAPRSGSTLLYQLLLNTFNTAYISNLMALIPVKMVSIAERLRRYHSVASVRESNFGYIDGFFSPSEAGAIQRFMFERECCAEEAIWIRNTFVLLSKAFNGPMITKNLFNTFRLKRIRSISLLVARKNINGSENIWWSIKPEGYESTLTREPEFQVLWQIMETEKIINSFCKTEKPDQLNITYEDLCENLNSTMEQIAGWIQSPMRNPISMETISIKNQIKTPAEKWKKIEENLLKFI